MNGFNSNNSNKEQRSLFVDVTFNNGVVNACLVGPRVGEREATIIANAVNGTIKEYGSRVNELVLDFSEVQFVSSLGLGMCIDVRNTAQQCQATTAIVGLTSHLKELFEMMRLDRLFSIEAVECQFDSAA